MWKHYVIAYNSQIEPNHHVCYQEILLTLDTVMSRNPGHRFFWFWNRSQHAEVIAAWQVAYGSDCVIKATCHSHSITSPDNYGRIICFHITEHFASTSQSNPPLKLGYNRHSWRFWSVFIQSKSPWRKFSNKKSRLTWINSCHERKFYPCRFLVKLLQWKCRQA